jgi:hypothetical protein
MIRQCPQCTYPLKVITDLEKKVKITVCSNRRCDYQRVRRIHADKKHS